MIDVVADDLNALQDVHLVIDGAAAALSAPAGWPAIASSIILLLIIILFWDSCGLFSSPKHPLLSRFHRHNCLGGLTPTHPFLSMPSLHLLLLLLVLQLDQDHYHSPVSISLSASLVACAQLWNSFYVLHLTIEF